MGWLNFTKQNQEEFIQLLIQHVTITGIVALLTILVGVPLGIYITRNHRLEGHIMNLANAGQAIPTFAFFGLVIPFMGIGFKPAIFALFIRGILPILRNTYLGITSVDKSLLEAGSGMGMTSAQLLRRVEIRLALPVIMAGIRTSVVISIGSATLASFIAAGGLGDWIIRGISMMDFDIILAGVIPTAALAILADTLLGGVEYALVPRGIRQQK